MWTFPLRHGRAQLGALDLYRDRPGALADKDMETAQTLADVAAAYLLNAQARDDARTSSEAFHHSSLHDPLTGLPNRVLLQQRLEHAAQRARRSHSMAAVLFADLDRFKVVNDSHGHDIGDQLLVAVARRLPHLVRPGDTLARVSGDEFVFLCEDLRDIADAETLAQRIGDAFTAPFALDDVDVAMTASVGMAFAGRGEVITPQPVVDADIAMYQAKRLGRGGHVAIDLRRARTTSDRTDLRRDLRSAFARDELSLAYQPVVRLPDGQVQGVEALLRRQDPVRGAVPPTTVVKVAEECGLIHQIGAWVLERACIDRNRWAQLDPTQPLDVAVNVSAQQLRRADFAQTVLSVLSRTGTDPAALVLEMTETVLIEDSAHLVDVLGELRSLGVRLALDDFGTGYSSLSYLRRLPVDIVKIDQTFISDAGHDVAADAVVSAVTQLAHALGLSVVAEGVETPGQQADLREAGCELAQGFLFSPPVPAQTIANLLVASTGGPLSLPCAQPEKPLVEPRTPLSR